MDRPEVLSRQAMEEYISANNIDNASILKVLLLGNSGTGKSFLCNAIVGEDAFEHMTRVASVTAENSFVLVKLNDDSGLHALICNIPGLIEAEARNIERNKAAVKEAFALLPGAPTFAVFVIFQVGGRAISQDHQAIRCTCNYIEIDTGAMAVVVNGIDWGEMDQEPREYRADMEREVRNIAGRPALEVEFVEKLGRTVRANYDSEQMRRLQGQMVALLRRLRPHYMQAKPGAELHLDAEKLQAEVQQLREQMERDREAHRIFVQQETAKWQAQLQASLRALSQVLTISSHGWTQTSGQLRWTAAGKDIFWGVNKYDDIYWITPFMQHWQHFSGKLRQIGVGASGLVAGCNAQNEVYICKGPGGTWQKLAGQLTCVDVGPNDELWGCNQQMQIFYAPSARSSSGAVAWQNVPGLLVQITVGPTGLVAGVNKNDQIFVRGGITGSWQQVPGALICVSAGPHGELFGVNRQHVIYHHPAPSNGVYTGCWATITGLLKNISVGPSAQLIGCNKDDSIYLRQG